MGRQLTMKVILLLFMYNPAFGAVQEADRTCRAYHTCLEIAQCPAFKEKHEDYNRCKTRRSGSCNNLQRELRDAVCNKKEKAVCCPDECVAVSECKYADERIKLYKTLKGQNDRKATEILNELKDRVCDRKKRFMWCPLNPPPPSTIIPTRNQGPSDFETSRPDYLPRLGSCGFPVHPGNVNIV
jgi:hypothetical protein